MTLPGDAVGLLSYSNDNPLQNRYSTFDDHRWAIASRTDEVLTLRQVRSESHVDSSYLGCIVTSDRRVVLWVNESRPLP